MRDPPIHVSKPDPVYEFTHYTSVIHQRFLCSGDMDYPGALVKTMAEYPPRRDVSDWNCLTAMACNPEETNAIFASRARTRTFDA